MTGEKEEPRSKNSLSDKIELMKDKLDGLQNLEALLLKLLENVRRLNQMLHDRKLEEIPQRKSKSRRKSKKHRRQTSLNLNCELCDLEFDKILSLNSI